MHLEPISPWCIQIQANFLLCLTVVIIQGETLRKISDINLIWNQNIAKIDEF